MGYYYDNVDENNWLDYTYDITIDPTNQMVKPESVIEKAKISNKIKVITGVTITNFNAAVASPNSYTWFGGLFNGKRSNLNWHQQSVFAIDFDNGQISVEDALKRLHSIHLYPQLWYTTLSSSEELFKFRIVLFANTPVIDIEHRDNIVEGLLKMFPEADQSCNDASRYYFGGKESKILHYEPIPTQVLLDTLCVDLITRDNGRVRSITSPTKNSSRLPGEKRTILYSIYRKYQNSPTGSSNENTSPPTYLVGGKKIDFDKARKNIKILDEFLNGTWLYHIELFGLATNLVIVKGGMKLMNATMKKYNELGLTQYTDNNFNIIKYLNNVEYYPMPISSFSKYKEDEEHGDIIIASQNVRGHIEQIETIVKIPLSEAEKLFKGRFKEVLENESKNINLFVLPTAIGKTEALTDINAVIAAPTNDLKNEISDRMKIVHVKTANPIRFDNESINRKIDYYYRIGSPNKVISILYDIAEKSSINYTPEEVKLAKDYIAQNKAAAASNEPVLTTHSRAMFSEFNNDNIVFDEDPLSSLIEIKKMSLIDLRKVSYSNNNIEFNNIIEHLESSSRSVIYETPTFNIDIESMIEDMSMSEIETNIFDFFSSDYYIRDNYEPHIIYYVIKRKFPRNKKIIVLSATLPVFIYKMLFGNDINIIDIKDVKQVGQVIQHTTRSCSRNRLNKYVKEISEVIGDKPVLTFKSFTSHFKNPIVDMYFGNCSGYDTMKGKDMAVVGTPHRNSVEYLLTAKVLGIQFKTSETAMTFQKIEYNGFRFMFNCYDHEELRMIQLALIETDLIQAVGRARTLRENAKVDVYSNFPLRLSNRFEY